jgi:Zn-dependent protease
MPLAPLLAKVNFNDPIFWAVVIGWVLTVVLHELAHGVVAYLGGDHTIRDRGGLTLNPLQYVHPVNSILLPAVFLLMGGVPLPGGATYVRRDLLRNRAWETAVSLAGPATNFVLFALLLLPLHPRFGWMHPSFDGSGWTPAERFLATLGTLQFLTGVFNLIPVPPLDGFGAISPLLPPDLQATVRNPQVANACMIAVFLLVMAVPSIFGRIFGWELQVLDRCGMDAVLEGVLTSFNGVMFGG